MPIDIFSRIANARFLPVIVIDDANNALALADAILAGGLSAIEITFRTPAAAEAIALIARAQPQMLLGAGTVLNEAAVKAAKEAGAHFGIAPGCNRATIEAARDMQLPFIPGVCTPSEIEAALAANCRFLKFYPAEALGGLNYLSAIAAPFLHWGIAFSASGGLTIENFASYLAHPLVRVVGGTWLAPPHDIAQNDWQAITHRCQEVAKALKVAGTCHVP